MITIGVDPRKSTHTASALLDLTHGQAGSLQIEATLAGYRACCVGRSGSGSGGGRWRTPAGWVGTWPSGWWRAGSRLLMSRRRPRPGCGSCRGAGAVRTTSSTPLRLPVWPPCAVMPTRCRAEDLSTVLSLLEERRTNLATARTRVVNQLHAVFRDLIPGGAPTALTATLAARILTTVRPASPVEQARKQIARDLVAEIRALDARLTEVAKRMTVTLAEHGSRLPEVAGIGPVVAARIVGRVGDATRFPTAAAFASYAGVAPIEVASGNQSRHRLSRSGDRQLNCALHIVAVTQVRMPASKGC